MKLQLPYCWLWYCHWLTDWLSDWLVDSLQCVVCLSATATMQTFPCGHRVTCPRCFVRTIQTAISDRNLLLRCVVCRARILTLNRPAAVDHPAAVLSPPPHQIIPASANAGSWIIPATDGRYPKTAGVNLHAAKKAEGEQKLVGEEHAPRRRRKQATDKQASLIASKWI